MDAYRLLREVERVMPNDPQVEAVARRVAFRASVRTVPAGARVAIADYLAPSHDAGWVDLGQAPLDGIRIPGGYLRWRITHDGYQPAQFGRAPLEGGVFAVADADEVRLRAEPPGKRFRACCRSPPVTSRA